MFCVQCGAEAAASARFCHACGTSLSPPSTGELHDCKPATDPQSQSGHAKSARSQALAFDERRGAATHVLKWAVRLAAGAASIVLAILANAILMDIAQSGDSPSWAVPLAIALHLSGGLLAFGVFFRWRFSRVVPRAEVADHAVRRYERTVGAALVGVAVLASGVAAVAILGLTDRSAAAGTVAIIAFLLIVSLISGGTGFGLRQGSTWSRRAALFSGFVFFGGIPIGTILALSLWWLAAKRSNLQMESTRAGS